MVEMIRVPETSEQMLPPKPQELNAEAARFLRAHWEEVKPWFQAMSGEKKSVHGSFGFDKAGCTFEVQRIAGANGFEALANVQADKLWQHLRAGYWQNTGTRVGRLEKQNRALRKEKRLEAQERGFTREPPE
jgi:hypothetical protein